MQRVGWTWKIFDYSKDFLRIITPERADYHRISICQMIEMIIRGAIGRKWTSWNCFHPKKIKNDMEQFEINFENVIKLFFQTRSDTVTYSMKNEEIPFHLKQYKQFQYKQCKQLQCK